MANGWFNTKLDKYHKNNVKYLNKGNHWSDWFFSSATYRYLNACILMPKYSSRHVDASKVCWNNAKSMPPKSIFQAIPSSAIIPFLIMVIDCKTLLFASISNLSGENKIYSRINLYSFS